MSYEDSNPGSSYGSSSGNPSGGVGGSRSSSGSGGGNGGSNYTFRSYVSNPSISGNWNTGGPITGFGSMAGGIRPYSGQLNLPRNTPAGMTPNPVALPSLRRLSPRHYPPVSGPPTRVDLNPATLAPWTGVGLDPLAGFRNPGGNYPAQYNGGGPGRTFGGGFAKDQSRLGGGGNGSSGGGWGGGGGGGW